MNIEYADLLTVSTPHHKLVHQTLLENFDTPWGVSSYPMCNINFSIRLFIINVSYDLNQKVELYNANIPIFLSDGRIS